MATGTDAGEHAVFCRREHGAPVLLFGRGRILIEGAALIFANFQADGVGLAVLSDVLGLDDVCAGGVAIHGDIVEGGDGVFGLGLDFPVLEDSGGGIQRVDRAGRCRRSGYLYWSSWPICSL